MEELAVAESRVVHESPVHGPELLAELNRLRARETELMKNWAADDHEARMLRFDLAEIETAALAEGRPAIAHMAKEARAKTADRKSAVMRLIEVAEKAQKEIAETNEAEYSRAPQEVEEWVLLNDALKPFRASVPSGEF